MQLSGISHRGSRATDNTKGDAAIADLRRFAAAGITTLDTADTFGDSEAQIGRCVLDAAFVLMHIMCCTLLTWYITCAMILVRVLPLCRISRVQ